MKFRVKTVLVAASLMVSACGGGTSATLDEYRDMYTGWCAYSVEVGVVNNSVTGCVNEMWQAGQSGEMSKPLHESFATMEEMNQYIALESGIRIYCNMIKESPTEYEQLLGLTRIGDLSYEECKDQLVQLNMISEILQSFSYDVSGAQDWRYEPGVTYRIDGDVYNDPFKLDYKNGASDVFGDGR
jgi:hypothetical protein